MPATFGCLASAVLAGLLVGRGADCAVWVSRDGDDRGPGTADRPFRTPARAIAAARESGRSPVRVKDGTYELDAPLALGPQDGGLVVEAAPGACPVFSAGRRITGWRTDARGWWHADVSGLGKFSQFYVNGVRRLRPFLPRIGYFEQGGLAAPEPGTGRQRIVYRAGDVDPAWTGFGDAEFCFFHVWSMSRMPPVAADAATRTVTLAHKALGRLQLFPFGRGKLYRIENVAAALGEPGDWYCDGKGNLTYVPLPGETPDTAVAVAAHHDRLIAAVGVTNAVFRGIAFAHANWNMPRDGFHCIQAAVGMPAAIEAADCAGFRLERCTVAHVGGWAVAFGEGSRDCAVVGCHLADLGGGGVKIGGVDFKLEDSRFTCGCEVSDTLIEHGGRTDPAATGVWIGHAHHSRVAHNTIRDMYYSGVSAGWRWELGRNPAHDNVIEWNHIHDIGQEVLSDMGGIYTLGEQPGTVERFNHIHDVMTERDGNGIYFDSGSSHIAVSNNFVHDISHATWFMARISRSNLVANNVFAHSRGVMLSTPERNAASTPSTFANNILVCDDETMMATGGTGREVVFTNNLVWCTGARKPPARPGFSLLDLGSVDVLARVPRLAGLEAAAARGFVPFSVAEAGCRGRPGNGHAVGEVPAVFTRVRPQVSPFDEGFENPSPDARTWGLHPASATNLVRVCEGVAATGAKSLEVVNALPGWTPHFSFSPYRDSGRVTVSFAVRLERGAAFKLSMRDINLGTLAPGPTITVDASAALRAGGRRLCELPVGQWIGIELSFELGSGREKDEFTLTAKVPGETSPRVFAGLPFHHLFRKVCWIGFMSACSKGERYYIDDLRVRP